MKEETIEIVVVLSVLICIFNAVITYYLKGLEDAIISTFTLSAGFFVSLFLALSNISPQKIILKLSIYFILTIISVSYTHLTLPTNREV